MRIRFDQARGGPTVLLKADHFPGWVAEVVRVCVWCKGVRPISYFQYRSRSFFVTLFWSFLFSFATGPLE